MANNLFKNQDVLVSMEAYQQTTHRLNIFAARYSIDPAEDMFAEIIPAVKETMKAYGATHIFSKIEIRLLTGDELAMPA